MSRRDEKRQAYTSMLIPEKKEDNGTRSVGQKICGTCKNYMESSGIFESVSTRYSRAIPDYHFATSIHQLEVIESKDAFSAHLNIEFRIINNLNNQMLLHHEADRTVTVSGKDLNLFANAVSNILLSELQAFTLMIDVQRSRFEGEYE